MRVYNFTNFLLSHFLKGRVFKFLSISFQDYFLTNLLRTLYFDGESLKSMFFIFYFFFGGGEIVLLVDIATVPRSTCTCLPNREIQSNRKTEQICI